MRKNQRGFSLLEAMVALVIMGVGLVAAVRMQVNTGVADQLARQRSVALQLARSKVEELRVTPALAALDKDTCSTAAAAAPSTCPRLVNTSASFNRAWQVTANADGSLDVTVQVSWKDLRSGSQAAVAGSADDNVVTLATSM